MNIDLLNYVKTKVQQLHCMEISTVIITAYLLPQLLEKLKPTFINMLTSIENLALCIICFKWNFGDISKSKKTTTKTNNSLNRLIILCITVIALLASPSIFLNKIAGLFCK